jgi:hypothetical protein
MRWALFLSVTMASLGSASRAHARASTRLSYTRAAEQCPGEPALRTLIATRLGYDPFVPDAPTRIEVDIGPAAHGLRARVRSYDAGDRLVGERTLTSPSDDCTQLGETTAVTISILLDPRSLVRRPVAPAPPPSPPPPDHESPFEVDRPAAPPVPAAPPHEPFFFRLGAGVEGALGAAPGASLGFVARAGVGQRTWSVDLEGRADLPSKTTRADGTGVRASLLLAEVVPCLHAGVFVACPIVAVGALNGEGINVGTPQRAATVYASAGLRAGLEVPIVSKLAATFHTDLVAPITRTTLSDRGVEVWTTPALYAGTGLGVLGRF